EEGGKREVKRNREKRGEREVWKEKRSWRDKIEGKSSSEEEVGSCHHWNRTFTIRANIGINRHHLNQIKTAMRYPMIFTTYNALRFLACMCGNDDDDNSVAKMKDAEEALEARRR
ncbi:unnamed protein product, partial [Dovyalis caffra]